MPSQAASAGEKVAWITGGSRGMGADTAMRLAERGYDIVITARDQERLDAVAERIGSIGRRVLAISSDLTDRASMTAFAETAESWNDRCDVLCNIGVYKGPGGRQLFSEMAIEELALTLEADVIAPAFLTQRAIPLMTAHGGGTIINMGSGVVFLHPRTTVREHGGWSLAYAAGKAGIDQFSKVLNVELSPSRIRTFTVEPGFVAYGEAFHAVLRDQPGTPVSPAECIGPAITWLVENPEASGLLSKRINLPRLAHEHGLLAEWDGPGTAYPTAEDGLPRVSSTN